MQSYCDVFKTVGEVLGPFDTAMIPIGAYKPRWFLRAIHCNPAEAVKIHLDVKAKQTVAMHWVRLRLILCRKDVCVGLISFFH